MFKTHTYKSVAREIVEGLKDGSLVLREDPPSTYEEVLEEIREDKHRFSSSYRRWRTVALGILAAALGSVGLGVYLASQDLVSATWTVAGTLILASEGLALAMMSITAFFLGRWSKQRADAVSELDAYQRVTLAFKDEAGRINYETLKAWLAHGLLMQTEDFRTKWFKEVSEEERKAASRAYQKAEREMYVQLSKALDEEKSRETLEPAAKMVVMESVPRRIGEILRERSDRLSRDLLGATG